ncbi:MAG: putative nucleotidyltransferase substrate binding domain-containing protein [Pyrinomonadaceae bacterium]
MSLPEKTEFLIKNLPDAEGARRFYLQFAEKFPGEGKKLLKNQALLSDVLTLASFSPLLAATLLQNPDYISWLKSQRNSANVKTKEVLLESLERFALLNSEVAANVLLARFRRRELLRIYLRDIRGLGTIAEITEEISNLADAILEYALGIARQELDNRYGIPLEVDEKNRAKQAKFCIVALGKLGSGELNYSSDIDLLFLYSKNGTTSGQGVRGAVTNREYFVKLAELLTKLAGGQAGEGAAYRIDLRLRPNGRVGSLAISLDEAKGYYQQNAQPWERQVLIRSRACAGTAQIFQKFFEAVEPNVFSVDVTIKNALQNVRLSKEKINLEKTSSRGFNVKLGKGGIREIEFIAQALQLAHGGRDEWLREPHTLISLNRLADRGLISDTELTELFDAYEFLRRLEHRLQMENGLQTHFVPNEFEKRSLTARRMNFDDLTKFDSALNWQTTNVNRIFNRVFGPESDTQKTSESFLGKSLNQKSTAGKLNLQPIFSSLEKSDFKINFNQNKLETLEILSEVAPPFAEMLAANPGLIEKLPNKEDKLQRRDYRQTFSEEIKNDSLARDLAALRKNWSCFLLEIVVFDVFEKISRREAKQMQTDLAQASVEFALRITKSEIEKRFNKKIEKFSLSVLGLGKLGGSGMDYGSDLDLILIYDEEENPPIESLTSAEFYARAVEIFVTALSSLTREGHLYRVDLRLRPDGKNGATSSSKTSFLNYLQTRAAIWEWLAYVKLRGVAGQLTLASFVETEARRIIHENALEPKIQDLNFKILRDETRRVRERLEQEKVGKRKGKEIDIKFGAGGMLDIYFAVRFLQLRHNLPDDSENRSTDFMLRKLRDNDFLHEEDFQNFSAGYEFLSELDHNLRLTVGRLTQMPNANQKVLNTIARRMKLDSVKNLIEKLTIHRLEIRESFENILGK